MLIPAIQRKDEVEKAFQKFFYTNDMMFETGSIYDNWVPEITDKNGGFQYVSVNSSGKLLGFMGYKVDWYSSVAYNFGIMSFDRGNPVFGKDIFTEIMKLLKEYNLHKIEWRMIGGNPAERSYDRFCNKMNGKKHILKDSLKDKQGKFRDNIIYEVFGYQ